MPPPIAGFVGSPTSGCAPLTVNFTDQSTNNPTSWYWEFGDGDTSTEQNPPHTYIPPGTYTVTLTVANAYGSDSETKTNYITVLSPPVADFVAIATDIRVGDSVMFTDQSTGNPTQWDWTFEGGIMATYTTQNPTVTYNTVGTFDVTLLATNACGSDIETKEDYIDVSETAYCTSWANKQDYEYIAGVAVADLNNPSGPSPYTDFTNLVAHIARGETVNVSLTPGFTGSAYTESWKIWIDYNGDHEFDNLDEGVFAGSGSSVVTGCFTVPGTTIIGDTRMRVSMKYGAYPTPCEKFTYGEVEDYTVNIADSPNPECIVGYCDVFPNTSINDYRYAQPLTMPADGIIESVSMYHTGGSGKMILGVYNGESSPQNLLGVTSETDVSGSTGWQTIPLESPTEVVTGGSTIWLAWVYEIDHNPGIRYKSGSPGAYQSPFSWVAGMPDPFGTGTHTGDIYSIYATYTTTGCNFGYIDVFPETSKNDVRRAQPFTMPQDGTIESISMYHEAGTGEDHMILAVYDDYDGKPQNRLAVTDETLVNECPGWQTISLQSPEYVQGGTQIWLAWVYEQRFEITTGLRYETGIPGAVDGDSGWTSPLPPGFDPMPDIFRDSSQTDRNYSIYANYIPSTCQQQYTLTTNVVGNGTVALNPPGGTYLAGTVVTLTAVPDSGWLFDGWSGDLSGTANPTTITMDSDKNVTANFSEIGTCTETVGYTTVFGSTSTSANRRALPFTMPENGNICSVTIYHAGGSGGLILGVYDGGGTPQNRLGVTPTTTINSSAGWQTIDLTSPAYVAGGSTVWLAWVFQSNPGIRYQTGSPGRYQSTQTWSGGMPDPFGSGSQTSYIYSIYATYNPD